MPYIPRHQRQELKGEELKTRGFGADGPGALNYLITMLCLGYIGTVMNYRSFNDVLGALEAVKLELYRRLVAEYEDRKKKENGDVFNVCS